MINVLIDKLPTKTIIDGKEYNLKTDFRNCLKAIMAFEDEELTGSEKAVIMLQLLYEEIPENLDEAVKKAILFLDCGEQEEDKKVGSQKSSNRLYSFSKDAKYIYSAIKQTHGIDLENVEYLHWWKFVYLFLDLNPDCFFCKIMDLRNKKRKGTLSKEEKKAYMQLYDIVNLDQKPQFTEEEQKEIDDFMDALASAEVEVKEKDGEL